MDEILARALIAVGAEVAEVDMVVEEEVMVVVEGVMDEEEAVTDVVAVAVAVEGGAIMTITVDIVTTGIVATAEETSALLIEEIGTKVVVHRDMVDKTEVVGVVAPSQGTKTMSGEALSTILR